MCANRRPGREAAGAACYAAGRREAERSVARALQRSIMQRNASHLLKLGAGHVEEGYTGLASHGAREEGLARAGRAGE